MDILGLPILAQTNGLMPSQAGPATVLFAALAVVAVLSAIGVVAFGNPIRSALCLVINFFTLAFLYLLLRAELLGLTQIVVYTGAIMVLFLFVLMLLNLGAPGALKESRDLKRLGAGIFGVALLVLVAYQVVLPLQGHEVGHNMETYGSPEAVGRTLFSLYVWPFEMASILLLVGIVGSILLAKRKM
jgi:NADH-quinone oxidoreductase subunit J